MSTQVPEVQDLLALADRCPHCGARALVMDLETGEIVCTRCGAVVREGMEAPDGGERNIGKDDDEPFTREHTGPPPSALYPIGRETVIGPGGGYYARLRALDSRGHDDRIRVAAAVAISTISGVLSLPRAVQEEAMMAFLRAHEAGATRGRSVRGMAAAAVLYACRRHGIPRKLMDVVRAAGLDKRTFWMHYTALVEALGGSATPPRPEDFVARLASAVAPEGAAGRVARRALDLLAAVRALDGSSMAGKDPMGLAAAAVYLAAGVEGMKVRQVDLAMASGLTEVTIRNSAALLRAALAKAGYLLTRPALNSVHS